MFLREREISSKYKPPPHVSPPLDLDALFASGDIKQQQVFDPAAHSIVSLSDVRAKNEGAINDLLHQMRTKGWCVVDLTMSPEFPQGYQPLVQPKRALGLSLAKESVGALHSFFQEDEGSKSKYTLLNGYGYSRVDHKQSLHYLSDPSYMRPREVKYSEPYLPPGLSFIPNLTTCMDTLVMDLIQWVFAPALSITDPTFAHRSDLPLAFFGPTCMLDAAWYHNTRTGEHDPAHPPSVGTSTMEVNCVPHYDPGLFSLSVYSSSPGLQLYDPGSHTWMAGPVNTVPGCEMYGVLWLGEAAHVASHGTFRVGVHRVVYGHDSRLTLWYEACTVGQIESAKDTVSIDDVANVPTPPDDASRNKNKNKKKEDLSQPRQVERYLGIPMSKVMRRSDRFAAYYSKDKEKE
eukprot:TRINITY_DN1836_c0_g1_i3.p1 TRINITY_DN1836_c0_g1~~TRINITY_DN1836_c0_g1_i3.p1  ORF type:complete len:404 (-),score=85.08 TRINITY_DN1836_c0_g1_i3:42-1253(-)